MHSNGETDKETKKKKKEEEVIKYKGLDGGKCCGENFTRVRGGAARASIHND